MEDDTAMVAAVAQPRPLPPRAAAGSRSGFFTFLKDGVLVTTRNRGVFLRLAALHAARLMVMLAARIVALRYLGPTLGFEGDEGDDDDGLPLFELLNRLLDGHAWLLPAAAACLVVNVAIKVLGLAIKAATACAAVASCSAASTDGGPGRTTLTLASLLGKVKRNLGGSMTTAVFVNVVWWASFVKWMLVTLSVSAVVGAYAGRTPAGLFLLLSSIVLSIGIIYYSVACEVAVVVSVAEPGLRSGGALRRARRLTRGTKKVAQATLHALLSLALNKAIWRTYDVAIVRVPHSTAAVAAPFWLGAVVDCILFWLGAVVVYMLVGAVEVLYTATVTAYYFDCKRTGQEETTGHIHVE